MTSRIRSIVSFVALCTAALFVTTAACAHPPVRELPAPCSTPDLATIEAAYVAEAIETCRGRTTRTCTELPAIEAKYTDKREAWIRCAR